jgi:hypothetical protein
VQFAELQPNFEYQILVHNTTINQKKNSLKTAKLPTSTMAIVRIIADSETPNIFISLEDVPVVLSDVRRALPELTKELRKKWPVDNVHIEERRPRLKNPIEVTQLIQAAAIGLVVVFGTNFTKAVATKLGDGIGEEITPHVIRWLKSCFKKSKTARSKPRSKRKKG